MFVCFYIALKTFIEHKLEEIVSKETEIEEKFLACESASPQCGFAPQAKRRKRKKLVKSQSDCVNAAMASLAAELQVEHFQKVCK